MAGSWLGLRSLKTRIAVFTLGIFLLGMLLLAFFTSMLLRQDMARVLGEQQQTTATLIATDLNQHLVAQVKALQLVASEIAPLLEQEPTQLSQRLARLPVLAGLFNSGVLVYLPDGSAVAHTPLAAAYAGVNASGRDDLVGALSKQVSVGAPHRSPATQEASFIISVPVLDAQGRVIAALSGMTSLVRASFLDEFMHNQPAPTGGYLLLAPASRLIVTSTDKQVLEPLPAPGTNLALDRLLTKGLGTATLTGRSGEELLATSHPVAIAGWLLAVVSPVEALFAPVTRLQQRMLMISAVFALLAGSLMVWLLKREFLPLKHALQMLTHLPESSQLPVSLPMVRDDEIGRLITGFNRLLDKLNQREAFLHQIFDTSSVAIFVIDNQGRLTQANRRMAEMFACPVELLIGREYTSLLHPSVREAGYKNMLALLANAIHISSVERIYCRNDGSEFWGHLDCRSFDDTNGTGRHIVCIINDISEEKRANQELRMAAIAFESQQGITITNADRQILRVNQAFTEITGYSAAEVVGQNPSLLSSGRHDRDFYAMMWESVNQFGSWQGEIWNRRKNGDVYPEWLCISVVKNALGQVTNYVATFTDISLRKDAENQIQSLAFYDSLTKLPNRRLLLDRLAQASAGSSRHQHQAALLYIDLDNFKTLNDALGYFQGDLLLQQVAGRLSASVSEGETVARLGSDEFVVMREDLSTSPMEAATQAEALAEKVIDALRQSYRLGPFEHHCTPSIGIALFGDDPGEAADQPLKRAELAMFQAKAAGGCTLRFFDPQMQQKVLARAALENDLREALRVGQFMLFYQPQVVGEGRLTGAEALVRWNHPLRGMVSPAEFIPLAEECGLILPLGQWVLETACAQLAAWALQPAMAHLTVAVNVSARQFHQSDFVDSVQAALARFGAHPRRLKLELTESLLVNDVDAVIAKMATLKAQGVSFSLDDFGTGYSSLTYLKRLPLEQLKIDQGFVRNILTDPNDAAIAKMVIALADSMGLAVIAEGVEMSAQRDFLAHLGCHAYQGYFFSRPVAVDAFEAWALATFETSPGKP